jgi:anhydro-N-acetylmuramic acid kinase
VEKQRLVAGLMSGTSADGMDCAIVKVPGKGQPPAAQFVGGSSLEYPAALRGLVQRVRDRGSAELEEIATISLEVSRCAVLAVRKALDSCGLSPGELFVVGAHGQTLFHAPPMTMQAFDPSLVAQALECDVVSDFRRADLACGGQGAPLVPFADYLLFRSEQYFRILLNIGGIANITILPPGIEVGEVVAFDTGPGNCVSDWLCRTSLPTGQGYDAEGALAAKGRASETILARLEADPWFKQPPPRSTDGPAMIAKFRKAVEDVAPETPLPDLLRTACEWTARGIVSAIRMACSTVPDELIASGGGLHNPVLRQAIEVAARPSKFLTTDELGVPSTFKEAIAFALLAAATVDGVPSNLPSVTGASRPVVLGSITPGRRRDF